MGVVRERSEQKREGPSGEGPFGVSGEWLVGNGGNRPLFMMVMFFYLELSAWLRNGAGYG